MINWTIMNADSDIPAYVFDDSVQESKTCDGLLMFWDFFLKEVLPKSNNIKWSEIRVEIRIDVGAVTVFAATKNADDIETATCTVFFKDLEKKYVTLYEKHYQSLDPRLLSRTKYKSYIREVEQESKNFLSLALRKIKSIINYEKKLKSEDEIRVFFVDLCGASEEVTHYEIMVDRELLTDYSSKNTANYNIKRERKTKENDVDLDNKKIGSFFDFLNKNLKNESEEISPAEGAILTKKFINFCKEKNHKVNLKNLNHQDFHVMQEWLDFYINSH